MPSLGYLPLLLPLGAVGAIAWVLLVERRRQRRRDETRLAERQSAAIPAETGTLNTHLDRVGQQAQTAYHALDNLPANGAPQEEVARIMETMPQLPDSPGKVLKMLRRSYKGNVPVLQAMIWLMQRPGYAEDKDHPELHQQLLSAILLKKKPAAIRLLLDRATDDALGVPSAFFASTLGQVIGHAVAAMDEQGETDLAARLTELQARVAVMRRAMILDWLPEALSRIDSDRPGPDWTVDDAFSASWPVSRGLGGAEADCVEPFIHALLQGGMSGFHRAALLNAAGSLIADGTIEQPAKLQPTIEAAMRESDPRLAEIGIIVALKLADLPRSGVDAAKLRAALEAYFAAGGAKTEEAAELADSLDDLEQARGHGGAK